MVDRVIKHDKSRVPVGKRSSPYQRRIIICIPRGGQGAKMQRAMRKGARVTPANQFRDLPPIFNALSGPPPIFRVLLFSSRAFIIRLNQACPSASGAFQNLKFARRAVPTLYKRGPPRSRYRQVWLTMTSGQTSPYHADFYVCRPCYFVCNQFNMFSNLQLDLQNNCNSLAVYFLWSFSIGIF